MILFHDSEDFMFFLKLVKYYMDKYKFKVYAVCLMNNHFHLLVKDKGMDLPIFMDAIESVYARYYIDKYKYKGRVFESRFKSNIITSDKMFMDIHRYINRNPVAAKIINSFLKYPWSAPTPETDKLKLIDFVYIEEVYKNNCEVGYLEYLESDVDDLWIDPIEVKHIDEADAFKLFLNLRERMNISLENITIPVYNEKTAAFIHVCISYGITRKQIAGITKLSLYKINKLLELHKNLMLPPGG